MGNIMKDLMYNINSVEVSYGDNTLNSVIQIYERISSIADYVGTNSTGLNDFEKRQFEDRLDKLADLNHAIQEELDKQIRKLDEIKIGLRLH
jgi:hypothetical protein